MRPVAHFSFFSGILETESTSKTGETESILTVESLTNKESLAGPIRESVSDCATEIPLKTNIKISNEKK